ncbi:hypothetical protein [Mycobacterium kansasii]|uniref:hypothetical protein n=1 Tax=Mycobacterium kansasii TaxID=1768 RepID=UPI0015E24BB2|nr:hypothetical protein [Mycobacterium kansasii]
MALAFESGEQFVGRCDRAPSDVPALLATPIDGKRVRRQLDHHKVSDDLTHLLVGPPHRDRVGQPTQSLRDDRNPVIDVQRQETFEDFPKLIAVNADLIQLIPRVSIAEYLVENITRGITSRTGVEVVSYASYVADEFVENGESILANQMSQTDRRQCLCSGTRSQAGEQSTQSCDSRSTCPSSRGSLACTPEKWDVACQDTVGALVGVRSSETPDVGIRRVFEGCPVTAGSRCSIG